MKRILLIAYHFPPIRRSSGIQRTLSFATHLRDHGWQPIVLTVHPRAYVTTSPDQLGDIPDDVIVERAFALDTARHLAVAGRYPRLLARPDRYAAWAPGGIWAGLRLIRRHRPACLWSTYPVATAHLIGSALQRLSGLPWVADFRDSMTEPNYPADPTAWRDFRRIERRTVQRAAGVVFTTPGARRMYAERYPEVPDDRWHVIPNGYDEDLFASVERTLEAREPAGRPLRLVHTGILYPSERDPRAFFEAVSRLKRRGTIDAGRLRIVLRATGHDAVYRPMLERLDIGDIVELAPGIAYREALAEQMTAHGLLIFQAASCNHQIPAKLYEYLRARRPVLALTDPAGDTAASLRDAGLDTTVPLDDGEAIERTLEAFLHAIETGTAALPAPEVVTGHSRAAGAARLARILETIEG